MEQKDNEEPPSVSVFIRPLEVTVPADLAPPPPSEPPPKTVWSTMTTRLETETSIKRWSTPQIKTEEGQPPGPEDRPETKQGQARDGNVKTITPSYKLGEEKPSHELKLGTSGHLPNGQGDYKVSMRHEDYKLTVIDPKVGSNANMPFHSSTMPDERRRIAGDFPSQHSKRSLIKLEPLEQRRFKSTESRPVTTSNYLTESVERHRDMEASRLREYLKAKEGDANQPWNKPGWPGPKKNDDESLRELEHIKKSIETLQKKARASSMQNLHLPSPSEFERQNQTPQPSPVDPGWLIKMRTNRYLDVTKGAGLKKHRSEDVLKGVGLPTITQDSERPENADPLHWQLRKEFHLTKYTERRASWSQEIRTESPARPRHEPPPPPPLPPAPAAPQTPVEPPSNLNKHKSRSQLLYPPGSTEDIASEKKPATRPLERIVYENKPLAPSVVAVNVGPDRDGQIPKQTRPQPPVRDPEEDYPERLMSPPPGHQPRSILKQDRYAQQQQYSSQQYQYSSQQQRQYQEEFYEDNRRPIEAPPTHSHAPQQAPPTHSRAPPPPAPPPQPMRPHSTTFQDLSEEERYRIMQENLQKHRQTRGHSSTPKQPVTSFNGPFFRIEEVEPKQGAPSGEPRYEYEEERDYSYSLQQMKQMSASEVELNNHYPKSEDPSVVVWPPQNEKKRPRSQSVMSRNIADPDRVDELRRQQALEREAMKRHEEEQMKSMSKQIRAMQIQQQRLYEQQHGVTSPVPIMDTVDTQQQPQQYPTYANQPQQQYPQPHPEDVRATPQQFEDPGHAPQNVRVFETRPISSMSDMMSPQPTWKRTYIVDKPRDVEKNQILTSEEILEKEQYDVDLLKRREAFVEKPEEAPEIHRVGRRWQPPPDKPYVWPTLRRAISVEPGMEPVDFAPGVPRSLDDGEYKWEPTVNDPGYRRERKNFTPTNSRPNSPRRGGGTGPLDEPAKRQTKYVIQPSPDGSHRPKPAFRKERHVPSGGFYPHAPNAIKVVKRRAASVAGLLSPSDQQHHEDVEVIQQRNYHRIEQNGYHQSDQRSASAVDHRLRRDVSHSSEHEMAHLNDWEKIYELPPHSSTISGKDVPRHVDVRRRLNKFEGSIQNLAGRQSVARAASIESSNSIPYPPPDYDMAMPAQRKRQERPVDRQENNQSRQKMSRRNSVASTRLDTPTQSSRQESRAEREHREHASRQSRPHSRAPSSIPLSPAPRGDTPNALRVRSQIARSTAPSPTPLSYERARAYQPPALPPGYRLGDPLPDPRATSPSPGHTKRMIRSVHDGAQRLNAAPQPASRGSSRSQHSVRDHRLSPNPRYL